MKVTDINWARDIKNECKLLIDRSKKDPDGTIVNKIEFQFKDKKDEIRFNYWYQEIPKFKYLIDQSCAIPIGLMRQMNINYKEMIFGGIHIPNE